MPIPQPPAQPRQAAVTPTAAVTGLSRTRSLRRPQATGLPGASTTTTTTTTIASSMATSRMATKPSSTAAPAKNTSPTRLPSKPTRAIPSAPTRLRTAAPTSATTTTSTTSTASTASRMAKPPSSSRTHLLGPSAPQAAHPPGTASTITRRPSSSSGRPLSSGGVPASPGRPRTTAAPGPTEAAVRGHARTRSTSAVTTSAASTSPTSPTRRVQPGPARPTRHPLTSAPVLRPPSAQSVQSSSGGSSAGVRATGGGRAPSGAATAATAPRRTQREAPTATATTTATASAAGRPRTRDGAAAKPVFNTLQQHYSPAKNAAPKPRVAAILAPPASPSKKPANVALSAETSRLQTHLLQLHILHRDAADVSAEWHASARHVLVDARFAALAADHAELTQIAAKRAESANAAALQGWASFRGDNGMTLEEKIQVLDEVLAGVWSLASDTHAPHSSHSASSSRYAQVVRRFERWAQKTAAQVEARREIASLNDLDDLSEDEGAAALLLSSDEEPLLDASWHEECGQLARRLQGWQRQLDILGRGVLEGDAGQSTSASTDREAQTSLARMLSGCTGLVAGMLEELQVMQQLEREAAEQELAWVRRINAAAGVGNDGQPGGVDAIKARAGAIWRTI